MSDYTPLPPPRRTVPPPPSRQWTPASSSSKTTPSASGDTTPKTWSQRMKATGSSWGKSAVDKGVAISDSVGGRVNTFAERKFGTEHFWPVTGDFPDEMNKAARVIRAFTVDGIESKDGKKKRSLRLKIPARIIQDAKGLAVFTSMRSGFTLGGAGGAGIIVARLPDGSWSAPAAISPNSFAAGFLIGVDVFDCVLVIRSQKALDSFGTHKFTLGAEFGVVAGPWGGGAAMEAGKEKAPVFSYVKSRGAYAGVEVIGQVFVSRFEENENMYHWPGIKAADILSGKVKVPDQAAQLMEALHDAESGRAQTRKPDTVSAESSRFASPAPSMDLEELHLEEGEVLKLPPTPDMTDGHENEQDPDTHRVIHQKFSERYSIYASRLTPPLLPQRRKLPPRVPGVASSEPSSRHSLEGNGDPTVPPYAPPVPPRNSQRDLHLSSLATPPMSPNQATAQDSSNHAATVAAAAGVGASSAALLAALRARDSHHGDGDSKDSVGDYESVRLDSESRVSTFDDSYRESYEAESVGYDESEEGYRIGGPEDPEMNGSHVVEAHTDAYGGLDNGSHAHAADDAYAGMEGHIPTVSEDAQDTGVSLAPPAFNRSESDDSRYTDVTMKGVGEWNEMEKKEVDAAVEGNADVTATTDAKREEEESLR